MANLTFNEKMCLEGLLGMATGYVLNFSDRTFALFVHDSVGLNIDDAKYSSSGTSKAKRLRSFWDVEPGHVVGKLIMDLIDYAAVDAGDARAETCRQAAKRLLQAAPVAELAAVAATTSETDFATLAGEVRAAIEANRPQVGLDRLHTFLVKYLRAACARRGISTERDKPLHSLMGEYIKAAKACGAVRSEMGERILKTGISLLESFNGVRNEHSFAHDNEVLAYEESLLIYNQVTSLIRFMNAVEKGFPSPTPPSAAR